MQNNNSEIGLFFGSFNPVHIGHLAIANYIVEYTDIRELWFVVTPQNPWKKSSNLLQDRQRQHMLELAVERSEKFKVSDIEFNLPKPNYTINTLTYLKEKFPAKKFSLIIGGDNLKYFKKWKNYEIILKEHKIYVYKRPDFTEFDCKDIITKGNIEILEAPMIEISSSFIRNSIKNGKDMKFFLPKEVYKYILANNYYRE